LKNKNQLHSGSERYLRRVLHFLQALFYLGVLLVVPTSCGVYSFTGAATTAKTISIQEFYNNTDLAPANIGETFTNGIKTYFIQNSNLSVVAEEGEIQL